MKERLQKILARAGHGSRRAAEALISAERVRVNGVVVSALGAQADPDIDRIEVDGAAIALAAPHVYLAMNKPTGVVTTASDPQARRTVMELLPAALPPHVFPIGRLDRDTEGLLLFTSDGEFAHRMAHPRYEMDKEYLRARRGNAGAGGAGCASLRRGHRGETDLAGDRGGRAAAAGVRGRGRTRVAAAGAPRRAETAGAADVRRRGVSGEDAGADADRGVTLARLARGKTRALSSREVAELRALVGLSD